MNDDASSLLARYLRQRRTLGDSDLIFANVPEPERWLASSPSHAIAAGASVVGAHVPTRVTTATPRRTTRSMDAAPDAALPKVLPKDGSPGPAAPDPFALGTLFVVLEGADEADSGTSEPSAARSDRLLATLLAAVGIPIDRVILLRLPKGYLPTTGSGRAEAVAEAWQASLREQITRLAPRAILSFGTQPTQLLLKSSDTVGKLRGGEHAYEGTPMVPTFALSMLVQNPTHVRAVWEDLQRLRSIIDG